MAAPTAALIVPSPCSRGSDGLDGQGCRSADPCVYWSGRQDGISADRAGEKRRTAGQKHRINGQLHHCHLATPKKSPSWLSKARALM
jgi:hypothetical protein